MPKDIESDVIAREQLRRDGSITVGKGLPGHVPALGWEKVQADMNGMYDAQRKRDLKDHKTVGQIYRAQRKADEQERKADTKKPKKSIPLDDEPIDHKLIAEHAAADAARKKTPQREPKRKEPIEDAIETEVPRPAPAITFDDDAVGPDDPASVLAMVMWVDDGVRSQAARPAPATDPAPAPAPTTKPLPTPKAKPATTTLTPQAAPRPSLRPEPPPKSSRTPAPAPEPPHDHPSDPWAD